MSRAILFDFDGTLAPNLDLPDMRRQVVALTQAFQVPDAVYADQYIVEVIEAAAAWLESRDGRSTAEEYRIAAEQKIIDIELAAAASTEPFAAVPHMLNQLLAAGHRLGIVTRNCRAAVLQVFPEVLEHVDVLSARDDTRYLKPDPRHLSECLTQLGCLPQHSVMVGDGHLDMRAGKALNMYCIGVLTGSGNGPSLTEAGAHHILAQLTPTNLSQHLDYVAFQSPSPEVDEPNVPR
ncbi:MAG: HAD family hydrolase [Pseudomonadota bacterium]